MEIPSKSTRTTSIEFIRFIAAVSIMLYHFSSMYLELDKHNYIPLAFVFVDFFFLLSGFFMMKYLMTKDEPMNSFAYTLHKAKSFYGTYTIVFSFQFIFFVLSNHLSTITKVLESLFHFKWEFLLLQGAGFIQDPQFGADYLLGQAWYLSAMLLSLIIAYPLARYFKKAFIWVICPVSIIVIYSYIIQTLGTLNIGNEYFGFILSAIPRGFAGTCAGALSYAAFDKLKDSGLAEIHRGFALTAEITCYISLAGFFVLRDHLNKQDSLFFILVFAGIILLAFLNRTPVSSFFNSHGTGAFIYLGKLSLYLYLTHWTVISAMKQFLPELPLAASITIFLGGSLIVSVLLKLLEEKRRGPLPVIILCLAAIGIAIAVA